MFTFLAIKFPSSACDTGCLCVPGRRWPLLTPRCHQKTNGAGLMGLPAGERAAVGFGAALYYSRDSPGIQLMADIKALPGILEQRECGWRSSPMNSTPYMERTPSARCARSLSIHGCRRTLPVSSSSSFSRPLRKLTPQHPPSFFPLFFFEHEFRQFKLPLNDKLRSPTLEKGPMCLKHLGRSIFLISISAVNSADQKVDQRLPGDRHLCLPPAEDRERN